MKRQAFTLVEAVFSIVLVAVMMVAALQTVSASARMRSAGQEQTRGIDLARQLLSEIMQTRYEDPSGIGVWGKESSELRANFDDVDDYDALSESPPVDRSGVAIPGFTGWTRAVQIKWAQWNLPGATDNTESGLKRITVTVTSPTKKQFVVTGLRQKYGLYERPVPATQVTYTTWLGISLQVGTDSTNAVVSSVNPVNQVP
jgi:MSHA pilin protein MshD